MIKIQHFKLDNGLYVLFHPMMNTHSVTIGLYIKAGCVYEQKNQVGITHLLEHLHFRKLGYLSQDELYYKMESIGSSLRAVTYRDFLKFSMKIIPSMTKEAMEIFLNIFQLNDWSDEEFAKEKQVVINQILEKGNYISIEKEVRNIVFKDHSLSREIMGEIEDVKVLNQNDVLKYKSERFATENMFLCITGNINNLVYEELIESLSKVLIAKQNVITTVKEPLNFQHRMSNVFFKNIQDDYPLELNISFDFSYDNKEKKDLLTILNCILGEGVGSKLQKHVREEKCYSSDIRSFLEWYYNFGVLHIRLSVEKKNLLACLKEIKSVLNDMKCAIVRTDLDVTLPFYTTNRMFLEDDTEEMNFELAYHLFVLESGIQTVTLNNNDSTIVRLQNLAKEVFLKTNMVIVVVGNVKGITKKSILEILNDI